MKLQTIGLAGAFLLFSGVASADFTNECGMPTIEAGEIGASLVLPFNAVVQTMFCGGTAGFTSDTFMDTSFPPVPPVYFIGTGNDTSVGTIMDLGAFANGLELVFFIYVRDTGETFYSGPGSRNPDGLEHAFVHPFGGGEYYVGFEDQFGGGDGDFDDIQFVVNLEPDADLDGVPDAQDECPNTAPGDVVDANGCSIDQLCPCDNNWKNHGQYVSCVAHAAEEFVDEGLISESEKDDIVSAAGQSACGAKH